MNGMENCWQCSMTSICLHFHYHTKKLYFIFISLALLFVLYVVVYYMKPVQCICVVKSCFVFMTGIHLMFITK